MDEREKTLAEKILYELKSAKGYSNGVYSNSKLIRKMLLGVSSDVYDESKYDEGLLNEILYHIIDIRDILMKTDDIQTTIIRNIETTSKGTQK